MKTRQHKPDPHTALNIRNYRLRRELTQKQVARRINIHRQQMTRIETGDRSVTVQELKLIALVLGVPPATLMEEIRTN